MPLPDFIGIGAPRCGTSTLHHMLADHPEICVPNHLKETHFFNRYVERGVDWYTDLFQPRGQERICGEFTPDYLHDPEVPARIHATVPDARLIAILRNPVERAVSSYFRVRWYENKERTFRFAVDHHRELVQGGRYAENLERFLELFPRERIKILVFEDFFADTAAGIRDLYEFLGVDPDHVPTTVGARANPRARPRWPWLWTRMRRVRRWLYEQDRPMLVHVVKRLGIRDMLLSGKKEPEASISDDDRAYLRERIIDDVERLSELLGRNMVSYWKLADAGA